MSRVLLLFLSAFIALLGVVASAAAEEPANGMKSLRKLSLEELMKVKVTSVTRSEGTVQQSAAAITVLTQEDIRRSGATTIPELLRRVPGLHVARMDGNKWAIASRGFNSRFAKNLLVQVDGRSVYNPESAGVVWDAVDYPLQDIERIEVIRGPGGSVWGANAVNGVINIITKAAKDTQGGLVSGGGGSEERGFGSVRYGGSLSEDLAFRVYGKGFDHDRQFSLEGDAGDPWWGSSTGLRVDWTPTAQDTLMIDAGYGRSVVGSKERFARATADAAGLFAPTILQDEITDTGHLLARWSQQVDDDSSWVLQAFWDRWQRAAPLHLRDVRFDTYDLDFQYQFALGARQKIVWGLGYRFVAADLRESQGDGGFALDWLDNDPHMQIFSGFLQDEIRLIDERLSLTLGTKLEHNNFTGWVPQPSGRLLWTPTPQQSVWVAASRALRTPSFTEDGKLFTIPSSNPISAPTRWIVANRSLRPEEVWAYELGHRVQATERLAVDTALFYNIHNDLRITRTTTTPPVPLPAPLTTATQFDNGMAGDNYGVELAADWRVTDGWRLYASYTFLEMQLHRDRDLSFTAEAPEGLDPQQQVYVQSSWDLPGNVEFDLIGRWVDEISGFNPGNFVPGIAGTVQSYFALDARLAWRPRPNLTLELVGQNLLDNHHPELGVFPGTGSPLVEIERGVYGTITFTF